VLCARRERFAREKAAVAREIGISKDRPAGKWISPGRLVSREEAMSTFVPSGKDVSRKWYLIDASGETLGRLATKAASALSGKLNPQYVPYIDMGDHVIVINAEKVRLTGLKSQKKVYRRYTGFPGGLREESFTRLINRRPEKVLEEAIKGMLPKTKLGRAMGSKLKVYRGDKHPHQAQMPVEMKIA
jgi:large subunit ribosomal protein L13